ncbi:MAG: prephenate dehydrogenase [Oscillospiraceae bacterium]|nr:prephenate dehydrogenase [Oscillospiraceae bacterium]
MKLTNDKRVLIVGLGLIGGSYAKALVKKGYHVSAITRSDSSITYALENGIISEGSTSVDPKLVGEADIVVLALYPQVLLDWIRDNQQYLKSGAVITDVTGVKCCVVYDVQKLLRKDVEFIAAHPMAGKEVYGVENSDDAIFRKANYIVTPTEANTKEAVALCEALGWELGFARVSVLTPEKHDDMIGFLSQLTHCIAVSLMNCNDTPGMEAYTGDSFRDLTRIARINDKMWSELFMCNREMLLHHMDAFSDAFATFRQMLADGDVEGMRDAMRKSTVRRALFDKK